MSGTLARWGERVMEGAWEARRRAYARGWRAPERIGARVASIGNLTVGGTGKTTLTLHLAASAVARAVSCAVVCRRYRPGPQGEGDEERMYAAALGRERVFAGRRKVDLARAAAAAGHALVVVDDGFSHWALARDLDIVLLDAHDPLGGGRLLPAGRLREPLRALQRADVLVVSRLAPGQSPEPVFAAARGYAPAAMLAAGRHRIVGLLTLDGEAQAASRVWMLTATGNPRAVEASAAEAGCTVVGRTLARDHHWFTAHEIAAARAAARRERAMLLVTAKDAVRWPATAPRDAVVLRVAWEWVAGGEALERRLFDAGEA